MTDAPSRAIMLFGTEEKVTPRKVLSAGPLSCELDGGNLRYVRIGGREAIRAIAFIVRDQDWGTYNPGIEDLRIDQRTDGFEVSYQATCKDAKQELRYRARIGGLPTARSASRRPAPRSPTSSPTGPASWSCIRSRGSPAGRSRSCTPTAAASARSFPS